MSALRLAADPTLQSFVARLIPAALAVRAARMEIRVKPTGSDAVFELETLIRGSAPSDAARRPGLEFIWLIGDGAAAPEMEIRAFDAEGRLLLAEGWPAVRPGAAVVAGGKLAHV